MNNTNDFPEPARKAVELDLDAIRARVDAATEGPWTADALAGDLDAPSGYRVAEVLAWSDPDAEFIAHARTDVPALLAEVERLQARVESANVEAATANASADEHFSSRLKAESERDEARAALADTVPAAAVRAYAQGLAPTLPSVAEGLRALIPEGDA
jgi:hypothetical protein